MYRGFWLCWKAVSRPGGNSDQTRGGRLARFREAANYDVARFPRPAGRRRVTWKDFFDDRGRSNRDGKCGEADCRAYPHRYSSRQVEEGRETSNRGRIGYAFRRFSPNRSGSFEEVQLCLTKNTPSISVVSAPTSRTSTPDR